MNTITIDPLVDLAEERALAAHWRNRALLQAQANAALRAHLAEVEAVQGTRIAALEARLADLGDDVEAQQEVVSEIVAAVEVGQCR